MDKLSSEVKVDIYNRLTHKELLELRVVHSALRDEIDSFIGFRVNIKMDDSMFSDDDDEEEENRKKDEYTGWVINFLGDVRAHSLKFENVDLQMKLSTRGITSTIATFPASVKEIQFGDRKCFHPVDEELMVDVLKDCTKTEELYIIFGEFFNGYVSPKKRRQMEKSLHQFNSLRVLELKHRYQINDVPLMRHAPFITSFLGHLRSPVLESMSLEIMTSTSAIDCEYPMAQRLLLPWLTVLGCVSNFHESLRRLRVKLFDSTSIYSPKDQLDWIKTRKHVQDTSNLWRVQNLTELIIIDESLEIRTKAPVLKLIKQQTNLTHFEGNTPFIEHATLLSILDSNSQTLKVLEVRNLLKNPHSNTFLDFQIFGLCDNLETIKLSVSNQSPRQKYIILNLGMSPPILKTLELHGFSFPPAERFAQLQNLPNLCPNLTQLEIELVDFGSIVGLTQVSLRLLRNCRRLKSLNWKIRVEGNSHFFNEFPDLLHMYMDIPESNFYAEILGADCDEGRKIERQLTMDNDNFLGPPDVSDSEDEEEDENNPDIRSYIFKANCITQSDRTRILENAMHNA